MFSMNISGKKKRRCIIFFYTLLLLCSNILIPQVLQENSETKEKEDYSSVLTKQDQQKNETVDLHNIPDNKDTLTATAEDSQKYSEKPSFNLPVVFFKGMKINLKDIGDFQRFFINGEEITSSTAIIKSVGNVEIKIIKDNKTFSFSIYSIYGILTVIPPLVAIVLALIFKDVLLALFIGIFTGSLFINRFDIISSFFNVVDRYVVEAVSDRERASIIVFTLLLGGMVGIITKSGGVKGIVDTLTNRVKSTKSVQFFTWVMGILIFFDDYTNTLVVGNTMRPLSDKWKVSREKLAYIVDSTAAPIACIALISTWIGFEISLINQSLKAYNVDLDAYHLFLSSMPYRFYPILAIIFVAFIFLLGRDYGPMRKAEIRAKKKGKVLKDQAVPLSDFESSGLKPSRFIKAKWYNGLVPIVIVIISTFSGLYISGKSSLALAGDKLADQSFFSIIFSADIIKDLGTVISSADSFKVLLWASLLGVFSAFLLNSFQRILKLKDNVNALVQGMKSMMMAIIILIMAWSLGVVLGELSTADFLVSLIPQGLDYHYFPGIIFIVSCIIAFSTGTSWGTLAIMYPLVIPIIITLARTAADFQHILVMTIASVLTGAVFGDHCSPISDTTIMSSMASSCDHIDHVKTQIPYALFIAFLALVVCIIPISFGIPYLLSFVSALVIAFFALFLLGKKIE